MFPVRLGKYIATRELGRGGSAVVYAAHRDGETEPTVALKVGDVETDGSPSQRRFLAEAEKLARIEHPAVVRVLDAGQLENGAPFIAMELCHGGTLAERIALGPLPLEEAFAIFARIADGLSALHAAGLLHRDIKPENVVLVRDHDDVRPVLIDLGIAKDTTRPASTTTHEGVVRGTPACMAPERFFGQPAAVATDVYEAALLFYVMVAGRSPWLDDADVDQRLDATPLADLADVPAALSDVVMRALSTRAARRPISIATLLSEMASARSVSATERATAAIVTRSQPPPAPTDTRQPSPPSVERAPSTRRSTRRPRLVSALAGAIGGGGIIAIGFVAARDRVPASSSPTTTATTSMSAGAVDATVPAPSEVAPAPPSPPPPTEASAAASSNTIAASPTAPGGEAVGPTVPESCKALDRYLCDHYGIEQCESAKASTKKVAPTMDTPARRDAWSRSCQSSLAAAIQRDEPVRSADRDIATALPTCQKVKPASCTADIVGDPATKPFCTQGEAMARNCTLMLTAEKAEECCATFIADLPRLVSQRRQQVAGDPAAKQDALEKYGLHKMPPPPSATPP